MLLGSAKATISIDLNRETRSDLKPDIGSQSGTVKANPDSSTDVYLGPARPAGKTQNWIQTAPGRGFFTILRLYNPLPSFFDKTWQPSEIANLTLARTIGT
jgi:hypothetical protein